MARSKRRKNKQNANNEIGEQETWSDLPIDILLLILSPLSLKDITCASSVCKSWFSAIISFRPLNKSPLLMKTPSSGHVFEFYNPSTRKTKHLELPQLCGRLVFGCSIDGWLLICPRTRRKPFFFNPYTQVSIKLPKFNLYDYSDDLVTFSSSPLCHDCKIFAVKTISLTTVAISMCKFGTKEWTTSYYPKTEPWNDNLGKIIYSNGLLYCQNTSRRVRIYDTQTCEWTIDVVPPPRLSILHNLYWLRQCNMVEHKGQIFLIYLYCVKEPVVFKLDQMNKRWKKITSLSGIIVFVNKRSAKARVCLLGMKSNNIYFPRVRLYGKNCIRYSVDEGRYYPNKKYSLPLEEEPFESIWIDPPADDASLV